jgi:hypothetical protein
MAPPMNPMSTFDPSLPAMVHDRLNDRIFEWAPGTMEANYRQNAVMMWDGTVEWDGLQLDGWCSLASLGCAKP